MVFQKPRIDVLAAHSSDFPSVRGDNLLFLLQDGKSLLKNVWYAQSSTASPYEDSCSALTLNDVPLIYIQSSGCPTCESLLAAGYGMPEDCAEIRQAAENLLRPYAGLADALERLAPVVGLLANGVYMLSISDYYPTDGDGHFFWDVPNDFTAAPASTALYDSMNCRYLPSFPCFLYPSQPTAKYDPARVEYYREKLRAGEALPPVLTYHVNGSVSVLLDGHHRACACALEGIRLPGLTLSPAYYSLNADGDIHSIYWSLGDTVEVPTLTTRQMKLLKSSIHGERVPQTHPPRLENIFCADLPTKYHEAVHSFPSCREVAALALYPDAKITPDGIHALANDTENDETESAVSLLQYLSRQKGTDLKAFAMPFTVCGYHLALREEAFRILSTIKNDSEIEDFFVDYLVNFDDRKNPLWEIANGYWETE